MGKMIVRNTPGLDGEYEADFDISKLTNGELRLIKKISGITAGRLGDGLRDGDNDLLVAYAVVFLVREGQDAEAAEMMLWDAPVGALEFDTTDDEAEEARLEADARPPDSPTVSGTENDPGESEKADAKTGSSGDSSSSDSDPQANGQSPTGSLPLETLSPGQV